MPSFFSSDRTDDDCLRDVLRLQDEAFEQGRFGPFILLCGPGCLEILSTDYYSGARAYRLTLRKRILHLDRIIDIRTDFGLSDFEVELADAME